MLLLQMIQATNGNAQHTNEVKNEDLACDKKKVVVIGETHGTDNARMIRKSLTNYGENGKIYFFQENSAHIDPSYQKFGMEDPISYLASGANIFISTWKVIHPLYKKALELSENQSEDTAQKYMKMFTDSWEQELNVISRKINQIKITLEGFGHPIYHDRGVHETFDKAIIQSIEKIYEDGQKDLEVLVSKKTFETVFDIATKCLQILKKRKSTKSYKVELNLFEKNLNSSWEVFKSEKDVHSEKDKKFFANLWKGVLQPSTAFMSCCRRRKKNDTENSNEICAKDICFMHVRNEDWMNHIKEKVDFQNLDRNLYVIMGATHVPDFVQRLQSVFFGTVSVKYANKMSLVEAFYFVQEIEEKNACRKLRK